MLSFFLLLFCAGCYSHDAPLFVSTTSGVVEGFYTDVLRGFLGIPYADVPVRFDASVPHVSNDLINATQFGHACTSLPLFLPLGSTNPRYGQSFITPPSEDCLNLNVWTPRENYRRKLPVYVWIHGGAHQFGSNQDSPVDTVAKHQDIIVVEINYRLGIFGYAFASGTDVTPNAGLLDVTLALKWVQDNIEEFGGNKKDVHLVGQSAGAANVLFMSLYYVDNEDGYPFSSMEVRSAGPMLYPVPATSEQLTLGVGLQLGCNGTSQQIVDCMRTLDSNVLLFAAAANFFFPTVGAGTQFEESFAQGIVNVDDDIPLMVGFTTHEARFFIDLSFGLKPENVSTEAQFDQWATTWILLQNGPFQYVASALELYKNLRVENGWTYYETLIELATDFSFRCGMRVLAEQFSEVGGNVYLYEYTHPFDDPVEAQLLDAHAFDLYPYYEGFQRTGLINPAFNTLTEREIEMGRQMQEWGWSMAKYGKPTKGGRRADKWHKFKVGHNRTQEVRPLLPGESYGDLMFEFEETPQCAFWKNVMLNA